MRYSIRKAVIDVVGKIWIPNVVCSQRKELDSDDIGTIIDIATFRIHGIQIHDNRIPEITREDVEQWLCMNAGDFQEIIDFRFSIEVAEKTVEDFESATEEMANVRMPIRCQRVNADTYC